MKHASDGARVSARRMQSRLREASLHLPSVRRPRWMGMRGDPADPSASMFQRIRRSMTLLYTIVLAVTLLLAGTVLYVAVDHRLMDPINAGLDNSTQQAATLWENGLAQSGLTPCDVPRAERSYSLIACYDAHGTLMSASEVASELPAFTNTTLVKQALASATGCAVDHTATAQDAAGGPPGFGVVAREACVARNATTNAVIGVVQLGEPIEDTVRALQQLLTLLLIVGGFTIVISAIGGFILSKRALQPARLAYSRQQRFIGDVSHELRTPLTLLRADAEMLLRGRARLDPDDAELLEDMVDETARLATLTTNLLTLARLDSANHLPERETLDMAEVAANVARRTAAFAGEKQVTVSATAPAGLLVNGVRELIDQAALILVDNGIKYNQPGGRVEVRAERQGDRVALIVSDTGPGVAPEDLEHLGERFYRPDKARTRRLTQDGGAGLGISIARSVAALHQGSLTFISAPGKGLTATFALPAARMRHTAPPESHTNTASAPEPHDAARL